MVQWPGMADHWDEEEEGLVVEDLEKDLMLMVLEKALHSGSCSHSLSKAGWESNVAGSGKEAS